MRRKGEYLEMLSQNLKRSGRRAMTAVLALAVCCLNCMVTVFAAEPTVESWDAVTNWTDIDHAEICCGLTGDDILFGFSKNGTLRIAGGEGTAEQLADADGTLNGWEDVTQIVDCNGVPVGLRANGDVLVPEVLRASEAVSVSEENLQGITRLIPVQGSYYYHYGATEILGVRENGEVVWIAKEAAPSQYNPEKDGIEPADKLMALLGDEEPTAVYTTYSFIKEQTELTVLTTNGEIISTHFPKLNGMNKVEKLFPVSYSTQPQGIIAVLQDGTTAASFIDNGDAWPGCAEELEKEISAWKNVTDVYVRYEDAQILAILADGSMAQTSYEAAVEAIDPTQNACYSYGVDVSGITEASFFTDGMIVLKDGSIAPVTHTDYPEYNCSCKAEEGVRVKQLIDTQYVLGEDGCITVLKWQ